MTIKITKGIEVSVSSYYQSAYSRPEDELFSFAYRIKVENKNDFNVRLLSREWNIFDSIGLFEEVKGPGVVGEQPVIEPGATYEYVSGCNLKSEMGTMEGFYTFENLHTNDLFTVAIPRFQLVAPNKLN